MKANLTLIVVFTLSVHIIKAQDFTIDADIRPRFEYRHGFNNLFPDNADPAAFVGQRSRLNFGYKSKKLKMMVSVQDVSTWGDTRQILASDNNNSFALFQAWIELAINENWSTRLGRQVISYDDQRIFGGLDWALQGRFHDAALVKYEKNKFKMDWGFAYSQEGQNNIGTTYNVTGFFSYKTMLYTHLSKAWENSSVSFLFLNNGFQKFTGEANDIPDGTYFRNTTGTHFTFPIKAVKLNGNFYYQFGKANTDTDLNGYQFSLEGAYKPKETLFAIGYELLSGTDQNGDNNNHSFFPLYGTNHKFNGFMDYFYVGNHANNVGLSDLYAKTVLKSTETSTLLFKMHYFASQADLADNAEKYLGTEVDVVFTQKLNDFIKLNVGYSHMFAGNSMGLIKGGTSTDNTNNWAWTQLTITPSLLTHSIKPND
ncbi:MAG: alginate export family protein [Bacteroidota bacterium]